MGLDINAIRFLTRCLRDGVSFERTLMIGRQGLFIEPPALAEIVRQLEFPGAPTAEQLLSEASGFAEPLFRLFGATRVDALDYAAYQGASVVHDMNEPIDGSLRGRYSVVVDGGTLEHVFDFPQAVKNCMEMVEVNGHFISITVANNFFGHGFYQFSPELFFRVLGPDNGFRVKRMIVYEEDWSDLRYYEVTDPERVKRRVTLVNQYPTLMMTCAERIAARPIFERTPQQSDYTVAWRASGPAETPAARAVPARRDTALVRVIRAVRTIVSASVPQSTKRWYRRGKRGPAPFDAAVFHETRL